MEIMLGLAEFVHPINSALMAMNPTIGQPPNTRNIGYTTEGIVSSAVKIAGSSYFQEDLDTFNRDTAYHLGPFANGSTAELLNAVTRLIYMLQLKFKEYQWYDSDGSCPWRFTCFDSTFNIQLGKPGDVNKINNPSNHP